MVKVVTPPHMQDHFEEVAPTGSHPEEGSNAGNPAVKQWKPKTVGYKQTAPNTVAEVAAMNGKALDAGSTEWLTTNGLTEPATGKRNPNGNMGFGFDLQGTYSTNGAYDGATIPVIDFNGAMVQVINPSDLPIAVPAGTRDGQVVLFKSVASGYNPIRLSGSWRGPHMRRGDDVTYNSDLLYNGEISLRPMEQLTCTWLSNRWWINSWEKFYKQGPGWRENEDGTYSGEGFSPFNPAAFPPFTNIASVLVEGTNGNFSFSGATL